MHKVTMEDIHKILYLNFFIIVFQSIERYGEKRGKVDYQYKSCFKKMSYVMENGVGFLLRWKKTDTRKINNFEEFNYDSLTVVK